MIPVTIPKIKSRKKTDQNEKCGLDEIDEKKGIKILMMKAKKNPA